MIEYSGKRMTSALNTVAGHLLNARTLASHYADGAAILIWDGSYELDEELLSGAVGMILPSFLDPDKRRLASSLAEFCHLPTLCISPSFSGADFCEHSSIAILAPSEGKLFVNPDIEAITSYLYYRPYIIRKKLSVLSMQAPSPEGCDGIVIQENERLVDEETAYEYFCEIADQNTGVKLVAKIPFSESKDLFKARIRALYRAGVWGRFSLLCTQVKTPARAIECTSLMRSVFCSLEGEHREFNGFIKKGICIDTPLLLLEPPKHRILDFFCLDINALCASFSGNMDLDCCEIEKYIDTLKKAALADLSLCLNSPVPPEFIERISPKEIYANAALAEQMITWI
ncbi:MAG: hypothetical protein E7577_07720 [Ruminococcaceae bacterium]|nr:hypothetical protein [Oscillospiraceae bacterium]